MKHLSKLLVVTLLLVGAVSMQAQDENNPWQVSFGVNAIDVYPTSDDNFPTQTSSFGNELFNASDHWNILPSISYIGVSRSVGDNLSVGVRGSLNKIDKLGDGWLIDANCFYFNLITTNY